MDSPIQDMWFFEDLDSGKSRAELLINRADEIVQVILPERYKRLVEHYCMYGDAYGLAHEHLPLDSLRKNTVGEAVDAKAAELNQEPVRVVITLKAVGWHAREQARYWGWYADWAHREHNWPQVQHRCCRDSSIGGLGAVVVLEDDIKGPSLSRVHPNNVIIDDAGCVEVQPPEVIIRWLLPRHWLARRHPELKEEIMKAARAANVKERDVLEVFEGWYEGTEDDPGRHVMACRGVEDPLVDEEWIDRFPGALLAINPPTQGVWGESDVARAAPLQIERNALSEQIQNGMFWHNPRLFVQQGAIEDGALDNEPSHPIETTMPPAQVVHKVTMEAVHPEVYAREQQLDRDIYDAIGASKTFAAGEVPARLESGRAQRMHYVISNRRHRPAIGEIQRFAEIAFHELAKAEARISKRSKSRRLEVTVSGVTKDITDALDMDVANLQIQAKSASALGLDAATEFDELVDLYKDGVISKEELWAHADVEDFQKLKRVSTSPVDEIEMAIDNILYEGQLDQPATYLDPPTAIKLATRNLMRATCDEAPADRLTMLRQWIDLVAQNAQEQQKMQMQMAAGAAGEAPPPEMGAADVAAPQMPPGPPPPPSEMMGGAPPEMPS